MLYDLDLGGLTSGQGHDTTLAHVHQLSDRGEMIRLPHDTIRIAIQGSRYDTYRDSHFALKK